MDEARMDRVPRVRLDLGHEEIWLTRFDGQGCPVATYPVSAGSVASAFNEFGADTGLLAQDTLFWQSKAGCLRIGIWVAPQVRTLVLVTGRKPEVLQVPMPGLVFVGEGHDYWLWAAPVRPTDESFTLWMAPLPNVHDAGHICFGNVKPPQCKPGTIYRALDLFFESTFNFHLVEGKITPDEDVEDDEGGDLIELLRSLNGKDVFPHDRLVRSVHPGTIGALMRMKR